MRQIVLVFLALLTVVGCDQGTRDTASPAAPPYQGLEHPPPQPSPGPRPQPNPSEICGWQGSRIFLGTRLISPGDISAINEELANFELQITAQGPVGRSATQSAKLQEILKRRFKWNAEDLSDDCERVSYLKLFHQIFNADGYVRH